MINRIFLIVFLIAFGLISNTYAQESYEEKAKKWVNFMKLPDIVFLSSINHLGFPESRAMVNFRHNHDFSKPFFDETSFANIFITKKNSAKISQIKENDKVSVYYYTSNINTRALLVVGTINIIDDKKEKQKYLEQNWLKELYPNYEQRTSFSVLKFNPIEVKSYYRGTIDSFKIEE